ncbi:MAG: DUF3048 domain-containing protein [Pseudolysinimonas sp.]|uniref:DUF3048 domain-containing protein n=1 Tax=Pseudolysinimonas sp. TaxID=2680009 RepID=UPI00326377D2
MSRGRTIRGRWVAGSVGALAAIALLAGCAVAPVPMPTPSYSSTYVTPEPTGLAPLTGAIIPVGSLSAPALSAKIDNHPDARPQVGLEHTDLLFEELVEGGLTRYVAVWHSDVPAEIGPIRSIRPMDPDIISPLGGIVAYSGGQSRFVQQMLNTGLYNAIHGQRDTDDLMYRAPDRPGPHDVIVKAQELIARHLDLAAPVQLFSFAPDLDSSSAVREGAATAAITARFSSGSRRGWAWDAASQRWLRSQDESPDLDSAGTPYSAVNVVVIRVAISNDGGVPKTELIGSGEAWVSSGGFTIHATWSKASMYEPIRIVDDTGTVVRLAPGNSWIELVPLAGSVDFAAPPPSPEPSPTP